MLSSGSRVVPSWHYLVAGQARHELQVVELRGCCACLVHLHSDHLLGVTWARGCAGSVHALRWGPLACRAARLSRMQHLRQIHAAMLISACDILEC